MNFPQYPENRKEMLFLVVLALAASFLLFYNLDARLLWQDEAQSALISKTILAKGIPAGTDGLNSFSQEMGAEYGPDGIYKWHPWLTFYVTAASFRIFGINTLAAKFPFALLGVLIVLATYFLTKEASGSGIAAGIAALLLAFNPDYLVLVKQSRYYAPVIFFTAAGLYEYLLIVSGKRKSPVPLVLYSVLLYYTQNINFACLAAGISLHAVIFKGKIALKIILSMAVAALFCLPWALYIRNIGYSRVYPGVMTLKQAAAFLPGFLIYINKYFFQFLLLLIPALLRLLKKGKKFPDYKGAVSALALFAGVYLVFISFFSVGVFYRYLSVFMVLSAAAAGLILNEILLVLEYRPVRWIVAAAVFSACGMSYNYLYEITHKYTGPTGAILDYIRPRLRKNDMIAVTYEDMPLKFYTDLKVIGGLAGDGLDNVPAARWIFISKYAKIHGTEALKNYYEGVINKGKYTRIVLPAPDNAFENRESPVWHLYRTVKNEDPVVIYERQDAM